MSPLLIQNDLQFVELFLHITLLRSLFSLVVCDIALSLSDLKDYLGEFLFNSAKCAYSIPKLTCPLLISGNLRAKRNFIK